MTVRDGVVHVAMCLMFLGCRQVAETVFDLPARSEGGEGVAEGAATLQVDTPRLVREPARPPIESTLNPDSARALLPKDHAGNIDWAAALATGVIRPRASIPDKAASGAEPSLRFEFDFYFPGPDSSFDAFFPHSTHTQWLSCRQCHTRIFRYRNTPVNMAEIFKGNYCGACHGKVAYPVTTGCERCHTSLDLPANRARPDFIGDIVMRRVTTDSSVAASDTIGNAGGVLTGDLPPARFPHWVHRIRYQCKACHMDVFEPRAGANTVLMSDIAEGEACGRCHDGVTAFRAGFGECHRCHVPTPDDVASK